MSHVSFSQGSEITVWKSLPAGLVEGTLVVLKESGERLWSSEIGLESKNNILVLCQK